MQITATELKLNLGKYLSIASQHDIFITKNGRCIARRCRMDYIVTRTTRDFKDSPVRALTPQEFLEL